jgi:hypothetical protein
VIFEKRDWKTMREVGGQLVIALEHERFGDFFYGEKENGGRLCWTDV